MLDPFYCTQSAKAKREQEYFRQKTQNPKEPESISIYLGWSKGQNTDHGGGQLSHHWGGVLCHSRGKDSLALGLAVHLALALGMAVHLAFCCCLKPRELWKYNIYTWKAV